MLFRSIYGDDQQKLLKTSNQIMKLITSVKGTENVDNGVTAQDKQLHLKINKNKAADDGLTVAQIYQQLAEKITTEKTSITITQGGKDYEVNVVNENNKPNYENILKTTIKSTKKDSEGNDVINKYKLSRYATVVDRKSTRLNSSH